MLVAIFKFSQRTGDGVLPFGRDAGAVSLPKEGRPGDRDGGRVGVGHSAARSDKGVLRHVVHLSPVGLRTVGFVSHMAGGCVKLGDPFPI